uniref:Fibronectin type-III domain-containing protein n=1 Tax=Anabas testudineus TaxID=64144 RepID=A0A3Q1J9P8_ANATE
MPRLNVSPNSKPTCSPLWLFCVLLGLLSRHTHARVVLAVPKQLSLSPNMSTQQLSISWLGGAATTFDLMILRTELNETVFYDTVSATMNPVSGRHQWTWTSVEPLQCTSLSIQIRSRDGNATSKWSTTQIHPGNDLPSYEKFQMYPEEDIVPVGANATYCCILPENKLFGDIYYGNTVMNATRLSRRSYAVTIFHQKPSQRSGTNIFCRDNLKSDLTGSVVFVGYPPLLSDFVCETHDLNSAVCHWNDKRDTSLYGKRGTVYSLNKRYHLTFCTSAQWEGTWTLVAVNRLGQYSLTDSAEISHRVHPVAPINLSSVASAWNATVSWNWIYSSYSSLDLVCEVDLTSQWSKTNYTFSGVGLMSVVLLDLHPDEKYVVHVRCGAQQNFWKWGNWSKPFSFKTKTFAPDVPNVWIWMNRDKTGQIIWKPLTQRQSHGQITGFEVTLCNSEENCQNTENVSADTFAVPINFTQVANLSSDSKATATVIARNAAGLSQPASVAIPLHLTDAEPLAVSRIVYSNRGFPLFWQNNANATCGYVVEWHDASCVRDCPVEWIKVAAGITNALIESVNLQPGVRYNLSLYSCSSELLQRWQGYLQELVPSSSVPHLLASQQDSDILLTWGEIPLIRRRGFLLGYNIYSTNGSQLTLLADWMILEILASLGITALFLVVVTFICYKKRKCMVHIVEKPEWGSSKEVLVVIPEEDEDEDGQAMGDEPADTDDLASLRYYNQAVDERPIRPRFPDSSASSTSSLDSGRTDVTYTGIQTSGSSFLFQLNAQGSSEGNKHQADMSDSSEDGGGGYKPQMQPSAPSEDMGLASSAQPFLEPQAASMWGYKPQCSWNLDSPEEADEGASLAPSLGSPTSVASTQFLLTDGEECAEEKRLLSSSAATWFTNLLSSAKP